MENLEKEISRTNKVKIFYFKDTGDFCGAGFLDYFLVNKKLKNPINDEQKLEYLGSVINKQKIEEKDEKYSKKEQEDILKEIPNLVDSITMEFSEWRSLLKQNRNCSIKIIDGSLIFTPIEDSLELKKAKRIAVRQAYRKEIAIEWIDDLENMPQEIKKKRALAMQEIEEIKNATEETIKNYEVEF